MTYVTLRGLHGHTQKLRPPVETPRGRKCFISTLGVPLITVQVRTSGQPGRMFSSSAFAKQVPFGTALALNATAADVQAEETDRMDRVFDRPTPFTKRGLMIVRATKSRQVAIVQARRIQAGYLSMQEEGGTRHPKRRAILMPAGVRRNKYGNMAKGAVKRLLARDDTFSGKVNGRPGIWQRKRDGSVVLLVSYETKAEYQPRWGFKQSAVDLVRRRYDVHFREGMARAMASAK